MQQTSAIIHGGADSRSQEVQLTEGVDLVVAPPGRLQSFIQKGYLNLSKIKFVVIEEADLIVDLGLLFQIKEIVGKANKERLTMIFSGQWSQQVQELSKEICNIRPVSISLGYIDLKLSPKIEQHILVVEKKSKLKTLVDLLQNSINIVTNKVLIFSNTKSNCSFVADQLEKKGYSSVIFHADLHQSYRDLNLESFKGTTNLMVTTDLIASDLKLSNLSTVINFDFPFKVEEYVRRV